MCSNALKLDCRMKKYQVMTGCLKWEHEVMLRRHQLRVKNMKPSVDNKCPNRQPFQTLHDKRRRLEEERVNKIEKKNQVIVKRLREIHEVKLPEFCHWHKRARKRGDAYRLKPPSGRMAFRMDWQSLRGSTERRSLRKQEVMLRRLMQSKKCTPEELKRLKKYCPRTQEVPIEYLDYKRKWQNLKGAPVQDSTVMNVEDVEPENILTKVAALRLHMHYGEYIPGQDSPYLDTHKKHKRLF